MASQPSTSIPVPQVPIHEEYKPLFASINAFVHNYMSKYDNSHDYNHILRVVSNAHRILQAELVRDPSVSYDTTALFLAALLHDVGDHKYIKPGQLAERRISEILINRGCSYELAIVVDNIVNHVSYSHEIREPVITAGVLAAYPELAIVQDADRLDAIGAVGIGRCFSYGAAKMPGEPMDRAIEHFEEKLFKLEGMMKTETGKQMARKRTAVLREFAKQWEEETKLSFEVL
ncbi:hypothetical protein J4E83_009111 [Alternaria metachromatica]|uniref:uncharacterized protein n=1 Tax=Alternaria metachromatica TaxID=283354 RepID=UPI0020C3E581|nr:uncharacterized protein J4E83_009111 [Alternaria metachromatica]KAI4608309.1 hypothetical protein J4E83_009111 [Alternaria metachromatica]